MADDRARVLADFIRTNLLADKGRPLTAATPLLSEGLLDSMGLVLLAAFVEERFRVRIEDGDLRAGALETIGDVLALVDSRR